MATQVQLRRGTKSQHNTFTGATAEVTVNTTNLSLHVHDGITAGGYEQARADLSNTNNVGVLTASTFSGRVIGNVTGNVYSTGISTFSNTIIGSGTTELIVNGDARITGILTIGTSSVKIDGQNNLVNVGTATTIHSQGFRIGSSELHSTGISLLNVNASGIITASNFNSTSDLNLKENITTVENPINTVNNLRGVKFDWKSDGTSSYGVIAQEIEQVLPELVSNGNHKTVNYNGIIAILIESIKSQQLQIDILKEEIESLKS